MRKVIFGLLTAIFLLSSAYAYHSPDGKEINIDFRYGISTRDYQYVDYFGYPAYRVYNKPFYYNSDWKEEFKRRREIAWLKKSFNERYDLVYGKASGEAFCQTCQISEDATSTNFRNKYAYDYRLDGRDSTYDYYYKPEFDKEKQYFNWRF